MRVYVYRALKDGKKQGLYNKRFNSLKQAIEFIFRDIETWQKGFNYRLITAHDDGAGQYKAIFINGFNKADIIKYSILEK